MMEWMKKHSTKFLKKTYFEGELDKEFNLESMRKYVAQKPELDKLLEKKITPYLSEGSPVVLDACCGIGHLSIAFHHQFPNASFLGVDETTYLIEEARAIGGNGKNIRFETDNLYILPKKYEKAFDISICWKTLSWMRDYEEALRALFKLTTSHIFISSLFYEGDIDYEIKVKEHAKERGAAGGTSFHNIYSLPRFERSARAMGAKNVTVTDFDIGIDLPRGDINHMGTYTIPLKDGGRLQMSGALPMPWKVIHIEL
jgi:2-polyprenyl-3-methyl-5-hydroxy-6-metoxy-1,4-benzoquinol methylase